MGKISILTSNQKNFLAGLRNNQYFINNFYFTGGTALAEYYLGHRLSDDLDFFSEKKFDSRFDIAVNKLMMVSQRTNVKDFVDLYYLFRKFTFWDLFRGVEVKFRQKLDPVLLASDFLKIEDFDFLPKMIKPLDLEELKKYYRNLAKRMGGKGVAK